MSTEQNWAGNLTYSAARLHYPRTVEEIQELVAGARRVKALGSRHSFNGIADCAEDLISLARLETMWELDRERRTVTIDGGAKYGEVCRDLHRSGFALPNMASLPHISVAGAGATATHGSGVSNRNLAASVSGLEFVAANGQRVALSRERDGDTFDGAVVNLGALGIVTKLTLDVIPTYEVRQDVYENLPWAEVAARFDDIVSYAYSVSLFTDWRSERFNQVWIKRLATDGGADLETEWFGATRATGPLHPIASLSADCCTEQMDVCGPWHERLPHFRMDFTPSSGEELQSEYFVPRPYAVEALRTLFGLREVISPLIQISEVRTIAADTLWMSPCYEQDCVAVHFTWVKDWPAVERVLPVVEEALSPYNARPHWGKLFTMRPAQVQSLYPRLGDFRDLLLSFDPEGKFRNMFLNTYILETE
jgi:alditol oxidase